MNYYTKKNLILSRPADADEKCIRLLLHDGTEVLVRTMKDLAFWKERDPQARVIGGTELPLEEGSKD
jgi:hypothetical protein